MKHQAEGAVADFDFGINVPCEYIPLFEAFRKKSVAHGMYVLSRFLFLCISSFLLCSCITTFPMLADPKCGSQGIKLNYGREGTLDYNGSTSKCPSVFLLLSQLCLHLLYLFLWLFALSPSLYLLFFALSPHPPLILKFHQKSEL
jgi:hypothetical protein